MKESFAIFMSFLAFATAQTGNATTYSPTGTWSFSGIVDTGKNVALTCTFDITVNASASSATATPSITGSGTPGGLCYIYTFAGTPYNISYDSSTSTLTIEDVYIDASTWGACAGDITGTWNDVSNTLTIDAVLPAVSSDVDCEIQGTLNLISPGDVTIS